MEIKQLYTTAKSLAEDAKNLEEKLFKLNTGIEVKKEDLPFLASDAKWLACHYNTLRIEIFKIHERNQLNGTNSDS